MARARFFIGGYLAWAMSAWGQTTYTGTDFSLTSVVSASTTYIASDSISLLSGFGGCCNSSVVLKAQNSITASGNVNVPSGSAGFVLRAGGTIQFLPGFHISAASGATMDASVGPVNSASPLTVTTTALQSGTAGTVYPTQTPGASGGTPPYLWSYTGNLPTGPGLSQNGGTISGTLPTTPGNFPLTVQVADALGHTAASPLLSISVAPAPLSLVTQSLPGGTLGATYPTTSLVASGGTPPYTWSVSPNNGLPTGVSLSSGSLTGTTTSTGTFNFNLTVTDSAGKTVARGFTIAVVSGASSGSLLREYVRMGSQTVAVESSATASVAISPGAPVSVATGDTQQFTAAVSGSSVQTVTWAATNGSITSGGLYTAPLTVPTGGSDSITATSTATGVSKTLAVTVVQTSVSVSPNSVDLYSGNGVQFSASVSPNHNTGVNWSTSPLGFPIVVGSVNSSGYYTAPGGVTSSLYNLVFGTSQANNTASNYAVIEVDPVPTPHIISISPTSSFSSGSTFTLQITGGTAPVSVLYFYINTGLISGNGTGCLVQVNGNGSYAVGDDNYGFSGSSYCTASAYWPGNATTGTLTVTVNLTSGAWSSGTVLSVYGTVSNTAMQYDPAGWQSLAQWTVP